MKIKVTSRKFNPLIKRKEIVFEVKHEERRGTPPRLEVRKSLASLLKADLEKVYVKKLETKTGSMITVGQANVYDRVEQARLIEPAHIIARNTPAEKPKEKEG